MQPEVQSSSISSESRSESGRVLATVLFTDIVASTERAVAEGDNRWRALLEQHHNVVREKLDHFRGHEVDTAGDSFFAIFDGPARAIRCACAIRDAVRELGLEVRAGLHTGECERMGDHFAGIAVHIAARVAAQAAAGEVLVSSTVRDLVAGSGINFVDRGDYTLKGIPEPWRVYAVVDREVPPDDATTLRGLRVLSVRRAVRAPTEGAAHNLPEQLSSFIGRESQLVEVRRLLDTARLLTLTGSGGAGKTRLALRVAGDLLDRFPDGVWLVELAGLTDPALVPQAVAATLRVREEPNRPLRDTLADYLRPRRLLLLLDNCEHLIAACAALAAELLHAAPGLHVLATSREPLGIVGERAWLVPSLTRPDPGGLPPLERLAEYEAVRLFVDRAVAILPTFALTAHNASAVAQVCHRLDGIPLAIELAAARVKVLSVEQITARLDDRFHLLTGGSRTALPRHQTLRAAMDWSHDLLIEPERLVFRRLGVFAGEFTLEAAEAVCAGEEVESASMLDLLMQLVDKSLLVAEERDGQASYRLLETVRQYAIEKLAEAGEATALRTRHRNWYLDWAERAEAELQGREQEAWLHRLDQAHDNLRAALEWRGAEAGGAETRMRLAAALWRFWYARGYLSEGRGWLDGALATTDEMSPAARARALNGAGALAHSQGDFERARRLFSESLTLRRALDDHKGIAGSLNNLGLVAQQQSSYGRATTLHEASLAIKRELGDRAGIAASLNNLGLVAQQRGDHERAMALHEESLAIKRELGDIRGMGLSLNNLGMVAREQGDFGRATVLLAESLARFRQLGDRPNIAAALNNLGALAYSNADYGLAAALHDEALALRRELGDQPGIARSLYDLGKIAHARGDYGAAAAQYCESLVLAQRVGDRPGIACCLEGVARILATQGQPRDAVRLFGAATALRRVSASPLPPSERAEFDRDVAAVRARVSREEFRDARKQGQAMPLAQAIADACRLAATLRTDPDTP